MNTDIDRIKEIETDAAIDAHMADAADQFLEERELLNTLTVQFAEVVELGKKCQGVYGFSTIGMAPSIYLKAGEFERLFGNNPDVKEKEFPAHNTLQLSIEMNGVEIYANKSVKYERVRA